MRDEEHIVALSVLFQPRRDHATTRIGERLCDKRCYYDISCLLFMCVLHCGLNKHLSVVTEKRLLTTTRADAWRARDTSAEAKSRSDVLRCDKKLRANENGARFGAGSRPERLIFIGNERLLVVDKSKYGFVIMGLLSCIFDKKELLPPSFLFDQG